METILNKKTNGFKYLKTLSLKSVCIGGELLDLILKNSPALEHLRVSCQWSSSTVRFSGPQCVLKCLELNCLHELVEISNVASLASLTLLGSSPKKIIIQNVPLLTSFCFGGYMIDDLFDLELNDLLAQFSSSLKSLTLEIEDEAVLESFGDWMWLPKLNALEKLVVRTIELKPSTTKYALLAKLCPSLKEFVLQVHIGTNVPLLDGNPEIYKDPDPHECLKEVKILGYYGCTRDIEIALYFIQNAVALEKIVIDPRWQRPSFYNHLSKVDIEHDARTRAKKQLMGKVPSRIKLVIL